jgi:cell division protein ZapA
LEMELNLTETKTIKVKILNNEYTLKVDDEELGYKVAEYVDSVMRELESKFPGRNALTIAVLTALNIAEELFRERMKHDNVEGEIENLLMDLSNRVDKILSL